MIWITDDFLDCVSVLILVVNKASKTPNIFSGYYSFNTELWNIHIPSDDEDVDMECLTLDENKHMVVGWSPIPDLFHECEKIGFKFRKNYKK